MASSISTLLPQLQARLKLKGVASEPAEEELKGFLRSAVKRAFGELPPIFETEALVGDDLVAPVPDLRQVLYVQSERDVLLMHEWTQAKNAVRLRNFAVARPGEVVLVWHTSSQSLAMEDDTDTVESSCALGEDWLEEYILELAVRYTLQHMINIAGSASGDLHGQQYRVSQDEGEAIFTRLERERGRFELMLRESQVDRALYRPPHRRSPLAGFRNRGKIVNRAAS